MPLPSDGEDAGSPGVAVSDDESLDTDYRAQLTRGDYCSAVPGGLRFGEQLTDDVLNSFCDVVQSAAPEALEGFLAVQTVQLTPEELPKLLTGQRRILQVLLDSHRHHYVLVEWEPGLRDRGVLIYDPLAVHAGIFNAILNSSVRIQLRRLFRHLYPGQEWIPLRLETYTHGQADDWSCGLRAAATVVVRTFIKEPLTCSELFIDVHSFHRVLVSVLGLKRKATVHDFHIHEWFKRSSPSGQGVYLRMNKVDGHVDWISESVEKEMGKLSLDDTQSSEEKKPSTTTSTSTSTTSDASTNTDDISYSTDASLTDDSETPTLTSSCSTISYTSPEDSESER